MMRSLLKLLAFLLLMGSCSASMSLSASNVPGMMDFSLLNWSKGLIPLDGEWLFYPEHFIGPEEFDHTVEAGLSHGAIALRVPEIWNEAKYEGKVMGTTGFGTYRLKVLIPQSRRPLGLKINTLGSAFQLWVNGQEISQAGQITQSPEQGVPGYNPGVHLLPSSEGSLEFVVQVSNFHHKEGGIWYSWQLGYFEKAHENRQNLLLLDMFLFGSLLIMGFYNIGLYFHLKRDKSPLYFGLLCLDLGFRIIVYGEYFILQMIPDFNWELLQKIGYYSFYWAPPLFYAFIHSLYGKEMKHLYVKITTIVASVFSVFTLFTPYMIYSYTLTFYQVWLLLSAGYMIWVLLKAFLHRRNGAGFFLAGFFILSLTLVNDILHTSLIIRTLHMVPFGVFSFIVFQSFVLTKNFAVAFHEVDKLSSDLAEVNASMSRFVPTEFLRFLGKSSIKEIQLGDHQLHDMAILFTDIRSFTQLSERMTPEENFRFINSYLQRISPAITAHGGFVDKFLGDGIMALFPKGPESAILGALDMIKALGEYNLHRNNSGYEPLKIGVGIHCGPLMMGTIGNDDRMDSTVIADAVNLTSRLEGLTKEYHATMIVSLDTLSRLPDQDKFKSRFLGVSPIKGKSLPVPIYEIFDCDDVELRELKTLHKDAFEQGVNLHISNDAAGAQAIFAELYKKVPQDLSIRSYLKEAQEDWVQTQAEINTQSSELPQDIPDFEPYEG